eukprot:4067045-Amphidinium_carterae.1
MLKTSPGWHLLSAAAERPPIWEVTLTWASVSRGTEGCVMAEVNVGPVHASLELKHHATSSRSQDAVVHHGGSLPKVRPGCRRLVTTFHAVSADVCDTTPI